MFHEISNERYQASLEIRKKWELEARERNKKKRKKRALKNAPRKKEVASVSAPKKSPERSDEKVRLSSGLLDCLKHVQGVGYDVGTGVDGRSLVLHLSVCRSISLEYGESFEESLEEENSIQLCLKELETPVPVVLNVSPDFILTMKGAGRVFESVKIVDKHGFMQVFAPLLFVMTAKHARGERYEYRSDQLRRMLMQFKLAEVMGGAPGRLRLTVLCVLIAEILAPLI